MGNRKEIRVFISSPSDCDIERRAAIQVLEELNKTMGMREGLFFQALRWDDLAPGLGKNPQAVIDEQLGAYDVLVGIMWMRFGTPIPGGRRLRNRTRTSTGHQCMVQRRCTARHVLLQERCASRFEN